jgi:hypothetical protein
VSRPVTDYDLLTPERLSELLARLDEVMTDAARLRRQITKQLNDQRRSDQQKLTSTRRRRAKPTTSKATKRSAPAEAADKSRAPKKP